MVDPVTSNLQLAQPLRGSNVGTWDVPVNNNTGSIDLALGGVASLTFTSSNITLATSQAQASVLRLSGTLTAFVTVTMTSIYKSWLIDNRIVNSPSSFCAFLVSTSGVQQVGIPPGQCTIFYDGSNFQFYDIGKIGEYFDYAGTTVPNWIAGCNVRPFLNCDGTAFSSATYPVLANLLGTTTLPDARGRSRFTLNQATGRLTAAGAGIDGNTNLAAGGINGITLASSNIPTLTSTGANTITVASTNAGSIPVSGSAAAPIGSVAATGGGGFNVPYLTLGGGWSGVTSLQGSNNITVTYSNASPTSLTNAAPGYVGGITMIRAG